MQNSSKIELFSNFSSNPNLQVTAFNSNHFITPQHSLYHILLHHPPPTPLSTPLQPLLSYSTPTNHTPTIPTTHQQTIHTPTAPSTHQQHHSHTNNTIHTPTTPFTHQQHHPHTNNTIHTPTTPSTHQQHHPHTNNTNSHPTATPYHLQSAARDVGGVVPQEWSQGPIQTQRQQAAPQSSAGQRVFIYL